MDPKTVREKHGLTPFQLATMLGVYLSTIRNWEAGKTVPGPGYRKLLKAIYKAEKINPDVPAEFLLTQKE